MVIVDVDKMNKSLCTLCKESVSICASQMLNLLIWMQRPLQPTTVSLHEIRVVAALGDSITAAFLARNGSHLENRGVSFISGGDPDSQSFAFHLLEYRKNYRTANNHKESNRERYKCKDDRYNEYCKHYYNNGHCKLYYNSGYCKEDNYNEYCKDDNYNEDNNRNNNKECYKEHFHRKQHNRNYHHEQNAAKQHSNQLIGPSLGNHRVQICAGAFCFYRYRSQDGLNMAQSGAVFNNLHAQAELLIQKMYDNPSIDMLTDYKLVNIFIGSNDACQVCLGINSIFSSPLNFEIAIRKVLETLKTRVPKLIVNLQMLFNVSQIYDLTLNNDECLALRSSGTVFECPCAYLGVGFRKQMDKLLQEYNSKLLVIWTDYQLYNYPGFAVILDPGFRDVSLNEWDISAVSKADCFHPSLRTHQLMARSLWNNLLRPMKEKHTKFNLSEPLIIPTFGAVIPTF